MQDQKLPRVVQNMLLRRSGMEWIVKESRLAKHDGNFAGVRNWFSRFMSLIQDVLHQSHVDKKGNL